MKLGSGYGWRPLVAALVLALGVLLPLVASAGEQAPLVIDSGAQHFPLEGRLSFIEDPGGSLDVGAVSKRTDFRPAPRPGLRPGLIWYRFTVLREAGAPADWVLAFGEPDIDDVRVFVPRQDGTFGEHRLGRHIPSGELPLAAMRHMAKIGLPEAQPVTVYVRLASLHKIRFEGVQLWQLDALLFDESRRAAMQALQFGVLVVLVMVYTLFGVWLRDPPMLLYALFVATRLSRGMTHSGLVTLVFPDAGSGVNYLLGGVGLVGGIAAFVFMWDRILDLRKNFPRIHKIYLVAGTAVCIPLLFVTSPDFRVFVPPAQAIMFAVGITNVVLASMLVRRNPKDALLKFYLLAFLPLVPAWGAELAALAWHAVPAHLGRAIDLTATMGHIGILSLALAYRLGQIQRARMGAEIALAGERLARQRQRTFVDMATHEFKTPLAVIDSAAQVLGLLTGGRPEIDDRLATIRRSVQRLVKLVETCLADEREEDMVVKLRQVAPGAIVRLAAERNRDPSRPDIQVHVADVPDAMIADAELLGIALDALIDNALRYSRNQAVELSAEAADGCVLFAVHDRGVGVPPADAKRIFDKYFRSSATGSIPGTGIGLHLVKTIAELHGGTVCHRPRDGGGSTFVMTIPVAPR